LPFFFVPLSPEAGGMIIVADELGNDTEIEMATSPLTTNTAPTSRHINDAHWNSERGKVQETFQQL
jgi:starvation-inducible outer membrane lipoprotein